MPPQHTSPVQYPRTHKPTNHLTLTTIIGRQTTNFNLCRSSPLEPFAGLPALHPDCYKPPPNPATCNLPTKTFNLLCKSTSSKPMYDLNCNDHLQTTTKPHFVQVVVTGAPHSHLLPEYFASGSGAVLLTTLNTHKVEFRAPPKPHVRVRHVTPM